MTYLSMTGKQYDAKKAREASEAMYGKGEEPRPASYGSVIEPGVDVLNIDVRMETLQDVLEYLEPEDFEVVGGIRKSQSTYADTKLQLLRSEEQRLHAVRQQNSRELREIRDQIWERENQLYT